MRLAMPDKACVGLEVEGAQSGRTKGYYGRIVDVDNPRHEKALRDMGAFPVNLGGRPVGGYHCTACGFHSYFTHCSKCGGTCTREI